MWLKSLANTIFHWMIDHESMIIFVGIAMVCALLSQLLLPGRGFGMVVSIAIGFAGCWVGNMFLMKYITFTNHSVLKHIVAGTAGAMLLTVPINLIRGGKDKDKSAYRNNP